MIIGGGRGLLLSELHHQKFYSWSKDENGKNA